MSQRRRLRHCRFICQIFSLIFAILHCQRHLAFSHCSFMTDKFMLTTTYQLKLNKIYSVSCTLYPRIYNSVCLLQRFWWSSHARSSYRFTRVHAEDLVKDLMEVFNRLRLIKDVGRLRIAIQLCALDHRRSAQTVQKVSADRTTYNDNRHHH